MDREIKMLCFGVVIMIVSIIAIISYNIYSTLQTDNQLDDYNPELLEYEDIVIGEPPDWWDLYDNTDCLYVPVPKEGFTIESNDEYIIICRKDGGTR